MISQLIYHSIAADTLSHHDIHDILQTARSNNANASITGCLLFYETEFLQILEGDDHHVQNLFQRISHDARHHNVHQLYHESTEHRMYQGWSMAYHAIRFPEIKHLPNTTPLSQFRDMRHLQLDPSFSFRLFNHISQEIIDKPLRKNH